VLTLAPRGKPGRLRVQLTAVDEAGNAASTTCRVMFVR
jgi:hypothetical protein